jgi:hypothetical protein
MTEVRRRTVNDFEADSKTEENVSFDKVAEVTNDPGDIVEKPATEVLPKDDDDDKPDDDGDELVMPDLTAAESLHKGVDITSEVIDATLKDVSPRSY